MAQNYQFNKNLNRSSLPMTKYSQSVNPAFWILRPNIPHNCKPFINLNPYSSQNSSNSWMPDTIRCRRRHYRRHRCSFLSQQHIARKTPRTSSRSRKSTVKLIYSEKATKFCEILTLLLTTVHTIKSKVKILQHFVAFSEFMNFNSCSILLLWKRQHNFKMYAWTQNCS